MQGLTFKASELPVKFRRSGNVCKGETEQFGKCYWLHKNQLLKFLKFQIKKISFENNHYMELKDMVDLQFLYNVFFEEKLMAEEKKIEEERKASE